MVVVVVGMMMMMMASGCFPDVSLRPKKPRRQKKRKKKPEKILWNLSEVVAVLNPAWMVDVSPFPPPSTLHDKTLAKVFEPAAKRGIERTSVGVCERV